VTPVHQPGHKKSHTTTSNRRATSPTGLPASCTAPPSLVPVSPTPTWPTGSPILDAVPGALAAQYPTVYGGLTVAPAQPGESAVDVNSHFVIYEVVHDPALEAEATAAYPSPLTVTFRISPRTALCLHDVESAIGSLTHALTAAGITLITTGLGSTHVVVGVTNCVPPSALKARTWFAQRFGAVVRVETCQRIPTTDEVIARLDERLIGR
jgi:hypothetical protein